MPVVIGGKPESSFEDPIGLLTDCHRRIERFLGVLAKVSEQARGGALTDAQRNALQTALRYFREAAPKHTADEEQSLFPRLRAAAQPEAQSILTTVDALASEHVEADRAHAEVDRLGESWLTAGSLPAGDAARFATLVAELETLYRGHISIEEGALFPAAAKLLDKAQRDAMGGEMAARRQRA
jgi:hemerythrin-like domain-containing protein